MQNLIEEIERCASQAANLRPDDLPALAHLHLDLLSLPAATGGGDKMPPGFSAAAESVARTVERLVLSEAIDGSSTIASVIHQIDDLQKMVSGATARPGPAPVRPSAGPEVVQNASAPAIEDERVINDADAPMAFEFVGEASGHLDAAEASLLKLEDDAGDLDEVNAVFRAFHTIKGVAGFLGLKQIGALAHAAETLLDLARKNKLQINGTTLDVVLETRDMMGKLVQGIENAAKTLSAPPLQDGLDDLLQRLNAAARGQPVVARPALTAAAEPLAAQPRANVATGTSAPAAQSAEHPSADHPRAEHPPAGSTPPAAAATTSSTASTAANTTSSTDGVVKVATGRLDALINAVGELVIAQAMVTQDLGSIATAVDQRLSRNLSHLGKITRGLQELSMSMRMVPIAAVFQKMARLTRDVSRKAGKEVEFVQMGGETELDRNVVEAISDPLVHMVRNSIDHGVEFPEDRVKAGKPRAGRVVLKAFHQGGNIVVEISDDGRGLNTKRILEKAIAAGIVKEDQTPTEQQIFHLIFHAGLSTAEKLTDISGRGVGMDVVRKNVEALRGRIEIASTPGKGSVFTVRLPLTLAVIDGLVVRVGTQRYILPITSIEQSIRPTAAQLSSVQGKGELCLVRERLLPLVRLHNLFKVEPVNSDPTKAITVIVQDGPDRACLLVDELVGQQQVVIKSVGKDIGELPGIAGCAILGDGNVSLILDVSGIIHSARK